MCSSDLELKDNGAAIIKVEWPDELIEKCGMMADVFSSVKLVTFDSCFKEIVEYGQQPRLNRFTGYRRGLRGNP